MSAPTSRQPTATSAAGSPAPVVGRAAELERIRQARALEGCPGVVVAAAAGVGKSRLARAAVTAAGEDGAYVAWVQATRSAATVPLAAFAGVLPPDVGADDPLQLIRQSASALRKRADGRPIVLGVDDAQLLDPSSATVVLHLAVTGTAFIVATVRQGEPCEDAVVSLWKDAGALRLELYPFDERGTAELIGSILDGPVEHAAVRRTHASAQGNALFVRELLIGAVEAGDVSQVNGLWRLAERPAMSDSLVDVVSARMAGLDEPARRAVELLALGEPLSLPLLVDLAGTVAVSAAERRQLVVGRASAADGAMRLAHPIYGDVVRSSLPLTRARALRLELAAVLQSRGPLAPEDALRVASWLLDAGAPIKLPLLLEAARAALLSGDANLAAELAGRAVAARGGVEATLLLARTHVRRKHFAEADDLLAGIEDRLDGQREAGEYLELRQAVLFWGLRRPAELRALLARAEAWWPDDPVWLRRLAVLGVHVAALDGDFTATLAVADATLADPELEPDVRREVEPLQAAALFYVGRTGEAYELSRRIRPSLPLRGVRDEDALGIWCKIAIETGRDWEEVDAALRFVLDEALETGDHAAAGLAALTHARLRSFQGRFDDARRWLAEAERQFELEDTFGVLAVTRALQVLVAGDSGRRDTEELLARSRAALDGREPFFNQLPYLLRAEGWSVHTAGDPERAQDLLIEAGASLAAMPVYAAQLTYDAMRAGAAPERVAGALAEIAARCDSPLAAAYAAHAAAAVAVDADAALAASETFEEIGAISYAAEAAAVAAGAFAAHGEQEAARRAAAHSLELHRLGEGGRAPQISGLEDREVTLTRREEELVELAREGLTNTEIAQRLVLSVRTVESHLYRAMHKLGITDRREL